MRRALAIDEKSFGPEHPNVAIRLNNLAQLLQATNRLAEAEPLYRRALAIDEKSYGPEHPNVAIDLNNLAELLQATNRLAEAEPLMRRALTIDEKSFGPAHPNVAIRLNNLALLLQATNRLTDAEPLIRRALAIDEKSFGAEHPNVAVGLANLAILRAETGDWNEAAELGRRAKPILTARRGGERADRIGLDRAALGGNTWALRAHARAALRGHAAGAGWEAFELAQWALQTEAADALSQMAARFAKGTGPLARVVHEHQNLIGLRQREDKRLLATFGAADAKASGAIRAAIADIDAKLDAIDKRLAREFPEYANLANPEPLTVAAVQSLIRPDEALIVFLDVPRPPIGMLPEEGLVWAVTKTDARWVRIDLGTKALAVRVAALRCGLDDALWNDADKADGCAEMVKGYRYDGVGFTGALPFDLERAHELYKGLFGQVEELIKDKHLLIVPSGPLTSLPFYVLVTEPPATRIPANPAGYRGAAWLGTRQPITVLPSVASLKALREHAKISTATKPYLGIGNPLLDGSAGQQAWAEEARSNQRCSTLPAQPLQVAAARGRRSPSAFPALFRGTRPDIGLVRQETPLPESAHELCTVAQHLGAPEEEVLLGARATETMLKDLSERGRLAEHRVVHFATHGALAGQIKGFAEPGLILTPPEKGSEDKALEGDDGYLAASEIATLKLDADWVILSACNTAGGQSGGDSAEALSGLARAFFYAGARALLVSHWAVESYASVRLITRAMEELKASPGIGRAEALRASMRHLIEKGTPIDAHPMQWAPFVVVGEGARS